MRKFVIVLILLILVSVGSGGYIYYSLNQISSLQASVKSLQASNSETSTKLDSALQDLSAVKSVSFIDEGQGIQVNYPPTWTGVLTTVTSEQPVFSEELGISGPLINWYEYKLTKDTSTLTFHRILDSVIDDRQVLDSATTTLAILQNDILRFKSVDNQKWEYAQLVTCAVSAGSSDVCYSKYFPGFGTQFSTTVSLDGASDATLLEADQIVLSAVN